MFNFVKLIYKKCLKTYMEMLKLWFHSDIPVFPLSKYQEVLKGYCPSSTSPYIPAFLPLHPIFMPAGKTAQLEEKLEVLKLVCQAWG